MNETVVSPDGRYWWNGHQWVAFPPAPTSTQAGAYGPIGHQPAGARLAPSKQLSPGAVLLILLGVVVLIFAIAAGIGEGQDAAQTGTAGGRAPNYTVDGDVPLQNVDARVRATGASWLTQITEVQQGHWLDFNDIYVTTDILEGSAGEQATSLAICQAYANASVSGTRIVVQGYRIETKEQIDGSSSIEKKTAGLARQIGGKPCDEI